MAAADDEASMTTGGVAESNPSSHRSCCAHVLASRSELVEHVMRMTTDDRLVLPFLDACAGSPLFMSAVGRLLADAAAPFPIDTPLGAWAKPGSPLDAGWRDIQPRYEYSLWSDLEFFRTLLATTEVPEKVDPLTWLNPYEELEALRTELHR